MVLGSLQNVIIPSRLIYMLSESLSGQALASTIVDHSDRKFSNIRAAFEPLRIARLGICEEDLTSSNALSDVLLGREPTNEPGKRQAMSSCRGSSPICVAQAC